MGHLVPGTGPPQALVARSQDDDGNQGHQEGECAGDSPLPEDNT